MVTKEQRPGETKAATGVPYCMAGSPPREISAPSEVIGFLHPQAQKRDEAFGHDHAGHQQGGHRPPRCPARLGTIWRRMIFAGRADPGGHERPRRTPCCFSDRVWPRTIRAMSSHDNSPITDAKIMNMRPAEHHQQQDQHEHEGIAIRHIDDPHHDLVSPPPDIARESPHRACPRPPRSWCEPTSPTISDTRSALHRAGKQVAPQILIGAEIMPVGQSGRPVGGCPALPMAEPSRSISLAPCGARLVPAKKAKIAASTISTNRPRPPPPCCAQTGCAHQRHSDRPCTISRGARARSLGGGVWGGTTRSAWAPNT